jgi:diguanylate cyclase (GGDEF)-like protein
VTPAALIAGRYQAIVEQSPELTLILDADGIVEYTSPACAAILDDQIQRFEGLAFTSRVHPHDMPVVARIFGTVPGEFAQIGRVRLARARDGWATLDVTVRNCLHEPSVAGYVLHCRDLAEHDAMERRIRGIAQEDALTRLPTRNFFIERLDEALRSGDPVTLFSVDLDGFRRVNEYDGHDVGDEVLRIVSSRLNAVDRERCTVARVGGDQFMVFIEQAAMASAVDAWASKLADAVGAEIALGERRFFLTATIGIAVAPADGRSAAELVRAAEIAMTTGKQSMPGCSLRFSEAMRGRIAERREAEVELRRGLESKIFRLAYQPEVHLESGSIVALEALIRLPGYRHSTEHLIRAAEESRLIIPISDHVLDLAIAELANWLRSDRAVRLAVNISPEHVRSGFLTAGIEAALARHGVSAQHLELEITEHVVLEHSDETIRTLQRLRSSGVTIAIDDFGTGYASLAYLRRFPVDKLKIDRTFVAGLIDDAREAALVDAIVSVAHKLGLAVVAEGVETPEQSAALRQMGCEFGQGYLFGKPVSADAIGWAN